MDMHIQNSDRFIHSKQWTYKSSSEEPDAFQSRERKKDSNSVLNKRLRALNYLIESVDVFRNMNSRVNKFIIIISDWNAM